MRWEGEGESEDGEEGKRRKVGEDQMGGREGGGRKGERGEVEL